jgi:hypothetical protein
MQNNVAYLIDTYRDATHDLRSPNANTPSSSDFFVYDCTVAQLTSSSRGCLHTLPRLEGTIKSAGLEVIDTWVCYPRCPITKTIALTSMLSAPHYPFFPNDRKKLTDIVCRQHGGLGED